MASDRQILEPLIVECDCGAVLRIANAWSSFRCPACQGILGFGAPEKRSNRDDFSNESSGLAQEVSV